MNPVSRELGNLNSIVEALVVKQHSAVEIVESGVESSLSISGSQKYLLNHGSTRSSLGNSRGHRILDRYYYLIHMPANLLRRYNNSNLGLRAML